MKLFKLSNIWNSICKILGNSFEEKEPDIPLYLQEEYEMLTEHKELFVEQMKSFFLKFYNECNMDGVRLDKIEPLLRLKIEEEINGIRKPPEHILVEFRKRKTEMMADSVLGGKSDPEWDIEAYIIQDVINAAFLSIDKDKKETLDKKLSDRLGYRLN